MFEGRLLKNDDTAYADDNAVALTNIGLMHLFSCISYYIQDQLIETIYNPGQATTMMGVLAYPHDFAAAQGLNQLWTKDQVQQPHSQTTRALPLVKHSSHKGTFSFIVALRQIFGFCDDHDKVIWGYKHTLTFLRASDNNAIFRDNAAAVGKVRLDKIAWLMPFAKLSLQAEDELLKIINNDK